MVKKKLSLGNEGGFILVLSLMVLVVLSIMGGAAMMVRNTEQSIATNTEIMQSNFYALEAVTLEGATAIKKADNPHTLAWVQENPTNLIDFAVRDTWTDTNSTETTLDGANGIEPIGYAVADRIAYAAVRGNLASSTMAYDICAGSDLSDPDKVERCYSVHGLYDVAHGQGKAYSGKRMLMMGYKKTVYAEP